MVMTVTCGVAGHVMLLQGAGGGVVGLPRGEPKSAAQVPHYEGPHEAG